MNRLDDARVAGSLEDMGAGIHRRADAGHEERWLTSTLPPPALADLLEGLGEGMDTEGVTGRIIVNAAVEVSLVQLTASHDSWTWRLDEVASAAQAALSVAEVRREVADHPRS